MLNVSYLWESRDASALLVCLLFAEQLICLPASVWIPWYSGPSLSAPNHLWVDLWHTFGIRLSSFCIALVATISSLIGILNLFIISAISGEFTN